MIINFEFLVKMYKKDGQIIQGTMGFCLFTWVRRIFNLFNFEYRKLNAWICKINAKVFLGFIHFLASISIEIVWIEERTKNTTERKNPKEKRITPGCILGKINNHTSGTVLSFAWKSRSQLSNLGGSSWIKRCWKILC